MPKSACSLVKGLINRRSFGRRMNSAITTVFDQHDRSDLRLVAWREAHKPGVILALLSGSGFRRDLRGAGFARHVEAFEAVNDHDPQNI